MKSSILFILAIIFGLSSVLAQGIQPLYVKFEGETEFKLKLENLHWNYEDDSLDEDLFLFNRINCDGVSLRVATINKRNYIEIDQSQLAAYNVKTDLEVEAMIIQMSYNDSVKYFMDLEREKKLYVVEIMPNNKAHIHQVRNITSR